MRGCSWGVEDGGVGAGVTPSQNGDSLRAGSVPPVSPQRLSCEQPWHDPHYSDTVEPGWRVAWRICEQSPK